MSGGNPLFNLDFFHRVATGRIPGWFIWNGFGLNDKLPNGSRGDVVGTPGIDLYTWSTSAAIDTISSSHTDDVGNVVRIWGLDENWDAVEYNVLLNGQNKVLLPTPLIRVNRATVLTGSLQGHVYIYEDTAISAGIPIDDSKVRAALNRDSNRSLLGLYSVPRGHRAFLIRNIVSVTAGLSANIEYNSWWRLNEGPFQLVDLFNLQSTGNTFGDRNYGGLVGFAEKSDLIASAVADTVNVGVSMFFSFVVWRVE